MDRQDVEPRDVVGDQQHGAGPRRAAGVQRRCPCGAARSARPATAPGACAPASSSEREAQRADDGSRAAPAARCDASRHARAAAPAHARTCRASGRRSRGDRLGLAVRFEGDRCRRPGSQRTRPGSSKPANGVCLPWLRSASGATANARSGRRRRVGHPPSTRPPAPAASDLVPATRAAPAPARDVTRASICAKRQPRSPRPTSAPGSAAARGRSRRARPRRTAASWHPRRPACGRSRAHRSCRRPAPARSASRSRCWRSGGVRRIAESK